MHQTETFTVSPQMTMTRLMAVGGHNLKQPLHFAMIDAAGTLEDGVTESAANRRLVVINARAGLFHIIRSMCHSGPAAGWASDPANLENEAR